MLRLCEFSVPSASSQYFDHAWVGDFSCRAAIERVWMTLMNVNVDPRHPIPMGQTLLFAQKLPMAVVCRECHVFRVRRSP